MWIGVGNLEKECTCVNVYVCVCTFDVYILCVKNKKRSREANSSQNVGEQAFKPRVLCSVLSTPFQKIEESLPSK